MASARGDYTGRPQYELVYDISVYDYSGGYVRFAYNVYAHSKVGYGSFSSTPQPFTVYIGNTLIASGSAALNFAPGDFAGKTIGLASGVTGYVVVGNWSFSAYHSNNGVIGSASAAGTINVATAPPPPIPVATTPDQITATTMRYQFNSGGDGGSPNTSYAYQWSTTPDFSSGNSPWIGSSGTSIITGLPPDTTIYIWSRAQNAIGLSGNSAIKSGKTLAASSPGINVTPALDGQSATVALTPPPDVPSPSGYRLEYRPLGGSTTALDVGSVTVVSPLSPGATYEWRAAAKSGTYTGPFSEWVPIVQPNPNISTGDFFDGNTAAKTDITYAWNGAVNNSTSRAVGKAVLGWGSFASGDDESGGSGVVYRITGGRSQTYAARVDFWTPTAAPGFHAGTDWVAGSGFTALSGAVYEGLIYVRLPVRANRVALMFIWVDGSNNEVGRDVGDSVLVPASAATWTALRGTGTPPTNAVRGALRVIDVEGPGWSLWQSGDIIVLDDAITPFATYYFDGNTADTATSVFVWDGTPNASISRELVSTLPPPNPLIDPDCPPVPAPPRPPAISDACVEDDTTEWRRFWQEIPADYVHTWIDSVPVLQIEASTPARLVRVRYYPNPFNRPLTELERDSFCSEQIISFIPGGATLTLDGMTERVYAEIESSSTRYAADSLLRTDSNVWPALSCGIPYYVTVDVPSDTPANALDLRYSLAHRY